MERPSPNLEERGFDEHPLAPTQGRNIRAQLRLPYQKEGQKQFKMDGN
jgi:hypothetical protein